MQCPLCEKPTLFKKRLESGLIAKRCKGCEGLWVSSTEYHGWLHRPGRPESGNHSIDAELDVTDTDKVKICPDCGRILLKFRIGHGIPFRLDHCNFCNGVWFDKNEWETLKSRDLHDHVHTFFTADRQNRIREEAVSKRIEARFEESFGSDYEQIRQFREWLDRHPQKSRILAYLSDPAASKP